MPHPLFSQGYHLQTTRDMRPHPSVTLDPATSHAPPFRSRNQSYMRAVSTLSQASCVSQVSLQCTHGTEQHQQATDRAMMSIRSSFMWSKMKKRCLCCWSEAFCLQYTHLVALKLSFRIVCCFRGKINVYL